MKKIFIIVIPVIAVLSVISYLLLNQGGTSVGFEEFGGVEERDIVVCEKDSDCIIVPYEHCCGSTKRAINRKYVELYFSKPEWHKFFDSGLCAVIGRCASDTSVTKAACEKSDDRKICRLQF